MSDKERLALAYQGYLRERKIMGAASNGAFHYVVVLALLRIVNLLEKK